MWMTVCMHTYVEDCDQTCDLGKLSDWKTAVNLHRKEHYVNQYQIRTGKTSLYSEKWIFWGYFYSFEHWNLVEFELTEQTWSCWETVKGRKCTISAEMNEEKKKEIRKDYFRNYNMISGKYTEINTQITCKHSEDERRWTMLQSFVREVVIDLASFYGSISRKQR